MKNITFIFLIFSLIFTKNGYSQKVCVDKVLTKAQMPIDAQSAAFLVGRTWETGQVINVKFLGGSTHVRNKVMHYAKEWENYANLNLNFISSGNAEIRISFTPNIGSWSYIGLDAQQISQDEPTMNFGWFDDNTSEVEFSRTTIHEFGHALGLIHEHQHPTYNIPWNKPVVYAYFIQSQGWSKAEVDVNIFEKYSTSQTYYCAYDENSIMHYPIPQEHTIGNFEVGWNTSLSTKDKSTMRKMYPFQTDNNPYWTKAGNKGRWYIGDFDGDGRDDIARKSFNGTGVEVILARASVFRNIQKWTDADADDQDWYVGDYNGDGKDDLMRHTKDKGSEVFLSTGTAFVSKGIWTKAGNRGRWYVGDFDGDGRDDIARKSFDGTGVEVILARASVFRNIQKWTEFDQGDQDWYIGDYNGDGKKDIFRYKKNVTGAHMFLSTGSQFFSGDEGCNF